MSGKKLVLIVVLFMALAAFLAIPAGLTQAAYRPAPNHPPECYPINFKFPNYWGLSCIDEDNNINKVSLETEADHYLSWDESYVEMFVVLDENFTQPLIRWEVCDASGECVSGTYQ